MRTYTLALLLALVPGVARAQNNAKVPDPDPELERKTFVVADGFEVNLWAADPLLAKPIQMNFDPQGRLWVASSEHYPQIKPGETANDKIIILEDTKGAGKADKATVFADGLLIPTGLEPGDGGVYVANSTELVHLSASKPGGKADKRRVLLSGFGTEDTHHIIHTFRWGPDCKLYFNQSIYIHSHVETPSGVKRLNAGGIWKFNPDKTELDVFARGWVNSWGHAFDKYGQSLATDGAGGEGINHVVPGGYYLTSQGPHAQRVLHGLNPGSPKYCGLEVVSGRHFPDDWQGDLITNDFRGHRVCRFKLKDDGSTFQSREMTEVIKSNHPAFRPIDVKMGPDGALYIADWYNPIIQHGEVDFRDPRRDKTHGRIWRVTAKGRDLVKPPKLVDATVPELLEQLKAPEQWTRQQAKRVLKERGAEKVLPELEKWAKELGLADANEQAQLEATWMRVAFGQIPGLSIRQSEATGTVFTVKPKWSPMARAAIVRSYADTLVVPKPAEADAMAAWDRGQVAAHTMTLVGVTDPDPRVRLETIRLLTLIKSSAAVEQALRALDKPMDRVLDYALWLTVRELEPVWLPEFQAGKLTFGGDARKLAFALNAIGNKDTVKPVLALIDGGKVPKENVHGLYLLLAQIGGPNELAKVLARAGEKDTPPAQRAELAQTVENAIRTRKVAAPKQASGLTSLLGAEGEARRAAMRIAGLWKVEEHALALSKIAAEEKGTTEDRRAALEGLVALGGPLSQTTLDALLASQSPAPFRRDAIIVSAGVKLDAAASKAAEFLPDAKPDEELADLFAAFLNRKGGASLLAKQLAGKKLNPDVAKIGLKAVRATGQPTEDLVAALTKAGGLDAPRKPPTDAEIKALAADAIKLGDAARGELVYRRKELQCLACHAYGGAGGQVGPDMTSIGASA
ncbi:MAG: sorbosone dehydrogenase, partial [Gemmataceae bacterium]|nr:sorbosone dehydrogenase [Gemmataceae bacterium]